MPSRVATALFSSLIVFMIAVFAPRASRAQSDSGGIRLTRVGTLGDIPPGSVRVVVSVDSAKNITFHGQRLDFEALRSSLQPFADSNREDTEIKASSLHAVLRLDQSVPWQTVAWTMQTFAHPDLRIYRLYFAVLPEEGEEEGYLAAWLPVDRGVLAAPIPGEPGDVQRIDVQLVSRGPRVEPAALYPRVRQTVEKARRKPGALVTVALNPGARVPIGYVLRVVDVLHRAGVDSITYQGQPSPMRAGGSPEDAEQSSGPGISLFGEQLMEPAGGYPPLPRVERKRGDYAGTTKHAGPIGIDGGAAGRRNKDPVVEDSTPPFDESDEESDSPFDGVSSNATVGIGRGTGGAFGHRRGRSHLVRREGGDMHTEEAVDLGLLWLKNHQDPAGFWSCAGFMDMDEATPPCDGPGNPAYTPGVSGLALLAFLGANETSRSGLHKDTVRGGLNYLRSIQDPEGCFGPRTSNHFTYNHAIATQAMAEGYGLSGSPLLKESAQRGVDFIEKCRNPYLAWRYGVRPQENDTSVSGWMVAAMKSAKAAGLDVESEGFAGMVSWLDKITDPEDGHAGYVSRRTGSARSRELMDRFPADQTEALTALGILSRIFCGEDPRRSEMIMKGTNLCLETLPHWSNRAGSIDMYYWYYGSLAMFQVGGDAWRKWNAALKPTVLDHQRMDGAFRGSWDPAGPWGPDGGRVYSTAIIVLCLETYYRYQRVFGGGR